MLNKKDTDSLGVDEAIEKLETFTDKIRFEPAALVSKRRKFFLRLPHILQKIALLLENLTARDSGHWDIHDREIMTYLADIYNQLSQLDYENTQNKQKALETISISLQDMIKHHPEPANKDIMKLYSVTVKVVVSYDKKLRIGT